MVQEHTSGLMEINMRGTGKTGNAVVREGIIGQTVESMSVNGKRIYEMVMELSFGPTGMKAMG